MIYPQNPFCPLNRDECTRPGGNNGNNNNGNMNNGNMGGGNTGNGNMGGGNMGNGNMGNGNMGNGNTGGGNMGNGNMGGGNSNMNRNDMLRRIMELEFAATDLNLYLDNHPDDREALEMFTKLCAMLKSLEHDYSRRFEPLTAGESSNQTPFQWVKTAWPWKA